MSEVGQHRWIDLHHAGVQSIHHIELVAWLSLVLEDVAYCATPPIKRLIIGHEAFEVGALLRDLKLTKFLMIDFLVLPLRRHSEPLIGTGSVLEPVFSLGLVISHFMFREMRWSGV